RPGQHPRAPPGGRRMQRPGCPEPCRGVADGTAVPPASGTGAPRAASRLPGVQPDQRRVVRPGDRAGRAPPRPGDGEPVGRRGAWTDAPGGRLRRDRLRQRRGPPAPRDVVSRLGDGPGLHPRRLPGRPAADPPRHVGDPQRPRRLPVHRAGRPPPGALREPPRLMGADVSGARPEEAGETLARTIIALMRRTGMPNGLGAVGYGPGDVDALVAGTIVQHRVTKLSPRPASE